jgi:hypothetical protein
MIEHVGSVCREHYLHCESLILLIFAKHLNFDIYLSFGGEYMTQKTLADLVEILLAKKRTWNINKLEDCNWRHGNRRGGYNWKNRACSIGNGRKNCKIPSESCLD